MTQTLVGSIAQFKTTLVNKTAVGATSATLTSGLDIEGVQVPTGTYGFLVDRNSSNKEYFVATLTGSALTNIETITVGTGAGTSGLLRAHRKGAEVIMTDHVVLKRMLDLLDGTTNLDSGTPLEYDGTASITTANQLATKDYVDGVAIAGGADASTSVKGITKLSVAPASATNPIAVGSNDPKVPTIDMSTYTSDYLAAQAGTSGSPSGSNKYVTADDVAEAKTASKIARRDSNSDLLVATTPTNADAATSKTYVDSKTGHKTGTTTYDISTASGTQTIAHGLGVTPNFVKLEGFYQPSGSYKSASSGGYDGTTNSCLYSYSDNASAYGSSATTSYSIRISGSTTPGSNYQTGVVTVDATNITITWTKTGSPTGTASIRWEAHG